ncbi:Uncharacterized protein APZ42_032111 [Daphnia magna]|uniref:Reverse transcriptase domain-containing protein n=1 Tax=Daphnia magna TaxID=35525 RepID=A0A164M9K4_9CRUS|nr:Uncharacterized protein APZ42_032111 [Daphnia magna]
MEGSCIVTPSAFLLATSSQSTGHALVQTDLEDIPVANLSPKTVWLEKGVTLGILEKHPEAEEMEEIQKILTLDASVKNRDADAENEELLKHLEGRIGENLTKEEKEETVKILKQFAHCFALNEDDLGYCSVVKHDINTANAPPIHQLPYKSAWKERAPLVFPSGFSQKKDGTWRFCVDYRKLNAVTVKHSYPLPRIADTLSRLEGAIFFSSMDLQSGYPQVPVINSDRPKTAFITADGLYQLRTLPFGFTNALGTFQRAMDIILAGLRWTTCLIYLDDVIIYSATFEQHLQRLRLVLSCLSQAGLKLKWSKCSFMEHALKVSGHLISKEGVAPYPEKLEAVQSFPSPNEGHSTANKVKRVQSFLGLCSYYRRHIQGFASIARPLTTLTKKEIPFTGWSIPSDELWVAYRESTVSVAAMENSFRLFIYVPIFDHAQPYKLFQIINLPGSTDNGTHGVLFVNLPDYLAVSGDLETFLELSKDNIKDCSKIGHSLCKFHAGVSKRTARKSCAIAVFMNDTPRINTQCRKKFTEWRGPEVVYMGSNQRVYSATKPHEIVFSCPSGGEQQKLRTTTLPPVGMFEIPLGCTARTEEWVFPASMEGNIMAPKLQAVVLPTVEIFSQDVNITKNKKHTFVELPRENTSSIDIISQLLHRNAQASLSTEMTEEQIHNLITETKKQKETSSIRYPYELVSAISLIALGLIALAYKLYTLSVRLAVHERYDNPPPGDCGREELEMQEA